MAAILKLEFFAFNGLFGDGTISYLFGGLENYDHAKFHAFNRNWTIEAHICSTISLLVLEFWLLCRRYVYVYIQNLLK